MKTKVHHSYQIYIFENSIPAFALIIDIFTPNIDGHLKIILLKFDTNFSHRKNTANALLYPKNNFRNWEIQIIDEF